MIEPTEDMIQAFWSGASWPSPGDLDVRRGLAAVLAIVERDYSLRPALCDEPCPTEDLAYCELQRGHAARSGRGHSATVTKAVDW